MKTIRTSELTGKVLDWAVAKAEGATNLRIDIVRTWWFTDSKGNDRALSSGWSRGQNWHPSSNWGQAGPIIERERIGIKHHEMDETWSAGIYAFGGFGHSPLIAAMRCYVASKLGSVVEVPDTLLDTDEGETP